MRMSQISDGLNVAGRAAEAGKEGKFGCRTLHNVSSFFSRKMARPQSRYTGCSESVQCQQVQRGVNLSELS